MRVSDLLPNSESYVNVEKGTQALRDSYRKEAGKAEERLGERLIEETLWNPYIVMDPRDVEIMDGKCVYRKTVLARTVHDVMNKFGVRF